MDAIVLDIEGTTTPIAFVYDVLFPFARRHLRTFLKEARGTAPLADATLRLELEWADDAARGGGPPRWTRAEEEGPEAEVSTVAGYVEWLMDRDRKSTALKMIQGLIWQRGYESGELKSDLFADVAPALKRWADAGIRLAIYSSGSVLAQRLLFAHTRDGDLTPYFTGFFDTTSGPKTAAGSYARIAAALDAPSTRLLFVSDAAQEVEAAHTAGCRTALCVRPGNPLQAPGFEPRIVRTFDEITMV
jgi:enolase-phosphatase E1